MNKPVLTNPFLPSGVLPSRVLPSGACDCHVHLFGPTSRYTFDPARIYTPGDADEPALNALHQRLGISRVVLVQPSVYGTDNRRLLDGLAALGGRARAVAVVPDEISDHELDRLDAAGVRGVRVNISTIGINDPVEAWRRIAAQAARVAPRGWHVQVLTKAPVVAALADKIAGLPCPLVVDHFGQPDLAQGPNHPAFRAIVDLARSRRVVVKFSAMERLAGRGSLARLSPFITALADAAPHAIVWGSDWPHTGGGRGLGHVTARAATDIEPFQEMDDQHAIDALMSALPEDRLRHEIFVANPARLYGFQQEPLS